MEEERIAVSIADISSGKMREEAKTRLYRDELQSLLESSQVSVDELRLTLEKGRRVLNEFNSKSVWLTEQTHDVRRTSIEHQLNQAIMERVRRAVE